MTAIDVLAVCQAREVRLVADGGRILLRGPKPARDELRNLIATHKLELLAVLRSTTPPARPPRPKDGPGEEWHADWRGRWVNLFGLRPTGGNDASN